MPNSQDSNVPVLQSYDQYLGDLLAAYLSATGINDLNVGSAVTSFFETVALTTARASGDAIQILTDSSADRATGDALQRIAADEGITPIAAQVSSGAVTIVDQSFQKISTKIYSGQPAPNIGTLIIYVSDASLFPATGKIYLGRGTINSEGPLTYSVPPVQIGTYWQITLAQPTTRYHNNNESVILAQGGIRTIPVNTNVQSPASGASQNIVFSVTQQALILDGDTTVENVQVAAQEIGTQGNVPAAGISQFVNSPYANLTVTNPLPFVNGRDPQTDAQLRAQIKLSRQSIGLGTATAIKNAVIGASSPSEGDTVVADSLVTENGQTTLYIDNGSTYEEKTQGIGIEDLLDDAFGGEKYFQLQCGGNQTSISKAFLQSSLIAPFNLSGGEQLNVIVGQISSIHTFVASDFLSVGAATAYEIVASINNNTSLLYTATTAEGGTAVVIRAIAEDHDSLLIGPVSGVDAAPIIGFPSGLAQTLQLYKNGQLLVKDGLLAEVVGLSQAAWQTIISGATLTIAVDGTPQQTYVFTDADFIAEGTYATVSASNSLQSWVNVINAKVPGITATILGTGIQLTSNKGYNDAAEIVIDPTSSLVTSLMFDINDLTSIGATSDYTLSRNTAQITLNQPLAKGDSLSAGIYFTEGSVKSSPIAGGTVTVGNTSGVLSQSIWFVLDDQTAEIIPSHLAANTVITVSAGTANAVRFTCPALVNPFYDIQVGDYAIMWSYQLSPTNRFEARVSKVDPLFNWFEITVTAAEYAAISAGAQSPYQDGIYFVRTKRVPVRLNLTAGNYTIQNAANTLQNLTDLINFATLNNTYLIASTVTKAATGSILVASVASDMASLGFKAGQTSNSTSSLIAFYEAPYEDGQYPAFVHSNFITTGASANPSTTFIDGVDQVTSAIDLASLNLAPNYTVGMLQPYGTVLDTLSPNENTFLRNFDEITTGGLTLEKDVFVKRLRVASANENADRFYVAEPLSFGANDKIVTVLNNDSVNQSFVMPMVRNITTNGIITANTTKFDAYDTDNAPTAPFSGAGSPAGVFPSDFSFNNFKVMMQAKQVLSQGSNTAILYRAVQWDQSGEYINVGYTYPTQPNQALSAVTTLDQNINVQIFLGSGAQIPVSAITPNNTIRWNITRTVNVGYDTITYAYSSGVIPNLSGVSVGNYVTIPSGTEFSPLNVGTFRVTAVGATQFSVNVATGAGLAETDRAGGYIVFFAQASDTASSIVSFVNANPSLSAILSATLATTGISNDGSGIISLSTYDNSGYSVSSLFLKDGVNWVLDTDLIPTLVTDPQFILKRPLALPTATGYSFFAGEPLKLAPTDIAQVQSFSNVLGVSGISNAGTVQLVEDGKKLEIATDILGGAGAVQIVGGTANGLLAPIVNASYVSSNQFINTNISSANIVGFTANELVKLTASNKQNKDLLLVGDESVTITQNSPIAGYSTVTLGTPSANDLTENRFGIPRVNQNTQNRTFKIEKQGLLTCLSWDGVGSSPLFSTTAELNYTAGDTVYASQNGGTTTFTIATGTTNFTQVCIGDLLTVTNMPVASNNGTFLVTGVSLDGTIIQVSNPNGANMFASGYYTFTANISNGDTFTINGATLIAGTDFTVGGSASASAENLSRAIGLLSGVVSTYDVNVVNPIIYVNSTTSSVPTLAKVAVNATVTAATNAAAGGGSSYFTVPKNIEEGDNLQIKASVNSASFAVENQGVFRVIRRFGQSLYYENLNSIEETHTIADDYIYDGVGSVFNVTNVNNHLVLTFVSGTNPTSQNVANPVLVGDQMVLGTQFSITNRGTFTIIGIDPVAGSITLMNPKAATDGSVTVTGSNLKIHHNAIILTEYNAVVKNDTLNISGSFLGANNQGQWVIDRVLNRNTVMIAQNLTNAGPTTLSPNTASFNVIERIPYVGYKKILSASINPLATQDGALVFDTRFQANKINSSAVVVMGSLTKFGFNTTIKYGVYSYDYDTGLLEECNKIVYGDPRDPVTYPGVAAAGAEIFIKAPLDQRIQLGIDVMIATGVSLSEVVSSVRTNVASLINSNPVGKSIAISNIIAAVNSIQGVTAVAISSPVYGPLTSTIFIPPSAKARILNLSDISVSQIT